MIKEEDVSFLKQLTKTLEQAELKMEEAHDKEDYETFNKAKKIVLQIQRKISEMAR